MNRLLFLLSICAATIIVQAQKADVEVEYNWVSYDRSGNEIVHPMKLLAGQKLSKFYYQPGEFVDSLRSTPAGRKRYGEMASAYMSAGILSQLPQKKLFIYVVKDKADQKVSVYDGIEQIEEYKFRYEEPMETQQWEVNCDSTINILGYECIGATCDWRGRKWIVWFSPEIPIDNGPWKLGGLPGLILCAEDATGQHRFIATVIMNSDRDIILIPGPYKYEKIDRKEMLKTLRRYSEDPVGVFNAATDGVFAGQHSTPISDKCEFLEIDYR